MGSSPEQPVRVTRPVQSDLYVSSDGGVTWLPWSGSSAGGSTTFGDVFPSAGIAIGVLDTNGNFAPLTVDASTGELKVTGTGGGGGAVTIANGADDAEGSTTDAKVVGDNDGTVSAKLRGLSYLWALVIDTMNEWVKVSIQNATLAVTQSGAWVLSAGSALIGKVSIDQTTPGTTNGVQVNAALPAGSNVIGHVIADSGSTTAVTQATAASLNATVVGTGTFAVQTPLVTVPLVGQAKIAVTGTRVQLGSNALSNGLIITALSTNAAKMTVGGSALTNTTDGTGNGYILEAGASASFAVANSNDLYINGTSGDIVSFAGS